MLFLVVAVIGCSEDSKEAEQGTPKIEESRAENLEKLMGQLQYHALAGNNEAAIEFAQRLFPTQQTLAMACESGANPEGYRLISEWIESVKPRNPKNYLKIYPFRPWQTELIVSSMTGAELASVLEKPEGFHEEAVELARSGLLRPDQEFFSVEFRKPGDKVGQRYEVFVWDSERMVWKMLGPIWRALSLPKKK